MRRSLRVALLAVGLASAGVMMAGDVQAARQYPINSTAYRKRMDALIRTIRTTCSARCPPDAVAPMMAALAKMEFRITEVCADGWVTAAEDDYVLAVMPAMPTTRP